MLDLMHRWLTTIETDPSVRNGLLILGRAIQGRRVGSGLTQRQLAFHVGFNQSTISRLERGQLRAMRLTSLARVLGRLNVSPDALAPGAPPSTRRRLPGEPR